MATTTTKARVTAAEFLAMDLGEGLHELVRGEIIELPPPGYWHGFVCLNAGAILRDFGRRTGHGHVASNDSMVGIDDETVRGADVCYYSEARWPRAQVEQGPPPVPPDVVVEVLSPHDRTSKVLEKVGDYLAAGVPVVIVLNPERRDATVYRGDVPTPTVLAADGVLEGMPELPGFRCRVDEFFA